jgi:NAD(P)-dependent dehydrogenase (short-subunit alcohol dehydrogenase family)
MGVLKGQTALVTGGSRGIGRAIALRLAAEGAEILIHYHKNQGAAEAVAREIAGASRLLQADLSSPQGIETMFAGLAGTRLDIVVNNAGVWLATPLGSASLEKIDALLDTNLRGLFLVTQGALPLMRDGGSIVNVSSVAGRIGIPDGKGLYGATKAAVDSLTKSWALELAPRRIRVNAVAPGYVETDMTAEHFSDAEVLQRTLTYAPYGRLGNAEEVADVVLFLCSPAARWVTGESINVSGGGVV